MKMLRFTRQALAALGFVAAVSAGIPRAAAADADPRDPRPAYLLGTEREERGQDTDGAIHAYEDALKRDPSHAPSHLHLGRILASEGKVQEASDHLKAAINSDPTTQARSIMEPPV